MLGWINKRKVSDEGVSALMTTAADENDCVRTKFPIASSRWAGDTFTLIHSQTHGHTFAPQVYNGSLSHHKEVSTHTHTHTYGMYARQKITRYAHGCSRNGNSSNGTHRPHTHTHSHICTSSNAGRVFRIPEYISGTDIDRCH